MDGSGGIGAAVLSVVLRDIVAEVSGPSSFGHSVRLQPEYEVNVKDAISKEWKTKFFVPLVTRGKEIKTYLVVFGQRRRRSDAVVSKWRCGSYRVRLWEPGKNRELATFRFELDAARPPGSSFVQKVRLAEDLSFSVRKWSLEALEPRDRW